MPKGKWRKILGMLACLALICGLMVVVPWAGKAEAQGGKPFTILHTNDEHSEVIPYGPAIDFPAYPTIGGFSRIASEIGRIKTEKAAAGEPVLTLSAGDYNQGTLFGWLETSAAAELTLMQMMGYDAIALGNHDFDMGAGYRAQCLAAAFPTINLPLLCANIQFDASDPQAAALEAFWSATDLGGAQLAIQPYTIKTLSNGLKVGIFGILGVAAEAVAPAAAATGVTFGNVTGDPEDPVSFINRVLVAQQNVNTLRAQGCDVVVALSHSGTEEEKNLAQYVSGIDVIVGGHTHELDYPPIMMGDTIIVQAGAYTRYLGELELEYADGKVSVRNANAIPIDQNIPTVPAMDTIIDGYVTALNGLLGFDILATYAETDIAGDGGFNLNDAPPFVETNMGDLVTDAYGVIASIIDPVNMVDIAFEANGLIRAGIPKGGTGHFSFYDLYRTVPLGVDLSGAELAPLGYPEVAFYLFGAEILGAMETTLEISGGGENDFFLQIAGAQFYFRPAGPDGGKVVSFEVDDGAGGWQPINPGALYKVATDYYSASFLASFGLTPRDNTGAPTTVDASIVHQPDTSQLKCWEALAAYVNLMPDLDGDGIINIPPSYAATDGRISAAGWYLAEGSTDGGMETFVLVQNPGDADVHVNIVFQTDSGEVAPPELQGLTIPANQRRTYKVNDYVTTFDVSTKVEPIDGEVICERAMYGGGRTWAHDSIGVTAPSPSQEWYLAEGSTDGGMETWLLVQNPYPTPVHVNIAFQTDTGEVAPPDLQMVEIPPTSRATFNVGSWVTNYNVSTLVQAEDGLVVCERAMYGNNRTWAHDSIGTPNLGLEWYLAEGSTDGGMETFVLVQNPDDTDAHVSVSFQTDAGSLAPPELQGVTIPANSRRTFKVNDWVTNYNVSTYVSCTDGAVVCERAMYGGGRTWAHDSIGALTPDLTWYLAEGSTDGGMETFVLVQNPGDTDAHVNITFQTDTGLMAPPELQGLTIPANSRRTFKVNDYVTTFNVSTKVESTDRLVVCERSMYGNNRTWAHDSIGFGDL